MSEIDHNEEIMMCKECLTPKHEDDPLCINCKTDFRDDPVITMTTSEYLVVHRVPCKHCHRPIIQNVKRCFACNKEQ